MRTPSRKQARARSGASLWMTAAALSLAITGLALTSGQSGDAATRPPHADSTSAAQARLVDRVPTPVLHWAACRGTDQCATAELPLDYSHPDGARIRVALLRVRAKDPSHRVGTIFVNPGGPGGSARDWAARLAPALPAAILDRFDIVGVDPRGVGGSTQIRCFHTLAERARAEAPFTATPFPGPPAQQRSWTGAARVVGRACSTTARSIASAMSTTEDARDLDTLRRAVGDRKLTYFGESYGSYLGLVYANMFPGRVRAVAIDGIVDPQAIVGTRATAHVPLLERMGSPAASYRALRKLLELCQQAGRPRCSFAGGNTTARYGLLAERLQAHPLHLSAPGFKPVTVGYPNLVAYTERWLHIPSGYRGLFADLTGLARLTSPGGGGPGRAALVRAFLRRHPVAKRPAGYDNQFEVLSGVICTDGLHAASAASWPAAAAAADRQARYFGAFYAWLTVQCARNTWTAQDPNVYRGPFDRRTAAPVLVVGGRWDPATSYGNAVKVARMLPSSRLVSSDNWGHESAGTSACVDKAIFGYLIHPQAPAPKVTHCVGRVQPFPPSPPTH